MKTKIDDLSAEDLRIGLYKLSTHIDRMEGMNADAVDLNMDTEPISRYLGGLKRAYELVAGIEHYDDEKEPK